MYYAVAITVGESYAMSSVDKFGRPLRGDPASIHKSAVALAESMQLDKSKQYNAHGRRIKNLAEPEDKTDAVNKEWIDARLREFKLSLEKLIAQSRIDLTDELVVRIFASENRISAVETNLRASKNGHLGSIITEDSHHR